jgi:hypothetical protein
MLFNKGLALGGAMLVVAIPGQWATLHAQSFQNEVSVGSTALGGTGADSGLASPAGTVSAASTGQVATATGSTPFGEAVDAAVDVVVNTVTAVVDTVVAAAGTVVDSVVAAVTPATGPTAFETTALLTGTQPQLASQPAAVAPRALAPAPAPAPGEPGETVTDTGIETSRTATPIIAKVFTVSTGSELRSALTAAQQLAGAEIRVNPGNYGAFVWNFKKYPLGRVYVVAATSTRPVFTSIQANSSSNMSFHGLKVAGPRTGAVVQMNASRNMSFTGGEVAGQTQDLIPRDEGATGIQVRFSTNVVVQDVRFSDLRAAMYVQRSRQVWIRYNRMSHIREGLNVVATDSVQMRGNHFSHFYPRFDDNEHPDALQLWTNGEVVGSTRVRISENLISMGGPRAIQGLLSGCEAAGVRHTDWEVSRNVYFGSSVHGLSFNCVDGLRVWNNVVVASPHADINRSYRVPNGSESGGYLPRLRVRTSTGVSTWNNVLMANLSLDSTVVASRDNWDIVDAMGWGGVSWTSIFAAGRPTSEAPPLSAFLTRNPSAAFTRNGGITSPFVHGARTMTKTAALGEVLSLLGA